MLYQVQVQIHHKELISLAPSAGDYLAARIDREAPAEEVRRVVWPDAIRDPDEDLFGDGRGLRLDLPYAREIFIEGGSGGWQAERLPGYDVCANANLTIATSGPLL